MKADLYALDGKKTGHIELPSQFTEAYRPDLILRAVKAIQSHKRQPYGAFPRAGQRASAVLARRRRDFKTSYGHGISRVPRKSLWRRGTQFGWVGAFAPGMVAGRRAHPPKAAKIYTQKMNITERRKALRSALAATINVELVKGRGHQTQAAPFILEDKFEQLTKAKDVMRVLQSLNLASELERISLRKIRAGRGKARNRKYKTKVGPLLVTAAPCNLDRAAANLKGIETCSIDHLNAELLAPGGQPARLVIYTAGAIKKCGELKLFTDNPQHFKQAKPKKQAKPRPKAAPRGKQ